MECTRCGARYAEEPSCGKSIHLCLPLAKEAAARIAMRSGGGRWDGYDQGKEPSWDIVESEAKTSYAKAKVRKLREIAEAGLDEQTA